jgi:hypothetical protein
MTRSSRTLPESPNIVKSGNRLSTKKRGKVSEIHRRAKTPCRKKKIGGRRYFSSRPAVQAMP